MLNEVEYYSADEFLFIERCYALTDFHIKKYPVLKNYDYNKVFNAVALLELTRLEEEQKLDNCIDFNDEIVEIEDVGLMDVTDITVDGDSLFYADNILTKNSYGLVFGCDILIGIITTPEFDAQNKICFKQLKNRYRDINMNNKFLLGVNKSKMKLYDLSTYTANPNADGKAELESEADEFTSSVLKIKRKKISL